MFVFGDDDLFNNKELIKLNSFKITTCIKIRNSTHIVFLQLKSKGHKKIYCFHLNEVTEIESSAKSK